MLFRNVGSLMRKNELLLDKFSMPNQHPLLLAKQVYDILKKEMYVDDLIEKVLKKRKQSTNVIDEARVLKGIGLLIALGKVDYYKGFLYKK